MVVQNNKKIYDNEFNKIDIVYFLVFLHCPVYSISTSTELDSTQQDITDVGAVTSYVRIYMPNLIKKTL